MSLFFYNFPKTYYKIDESNDLDTVTNITANFSILNSSINATQGYYDYTISEGDTPEMVAYKVYGDAEYHWLVMRVNGIMNLNTDWPLAYSQLMDSIEKTYGIAYAQTNYKTHYKIEKKLLVKTGDYLEEYVTIDATTYASLTPISTFYTLPDGTSMRGTQVAKPEDKIVASCCNLPSRADTSGCTWNRFSKNALTRSESFGLARPGPSSSLIRAHMSSTSWLSTMRSRGHWTVSD